MIRSSSGNQRSLVLGLGLLIMCVLSAGCSGSTDKNISANGSASTTTSIPATTPEQLASFCSAIVALNKTDGTTEEGVVLDVLKEVRNTAPHKLAGDVALLADNLILNNYPGGVAETMKQASPEEVNAAGNRLEQFVDQNCDLTG